jgi:hypothetical protein
MHKKIIVLSFLFLTFSESTTANQGGNVSNYTAKYWQDENVMDMDMNYFNPARKRKRNILPSGNYSSRSHFITAGKKISKPLRKNISRGDIGKLLTFKFESDVPGKIKSIEFKRRGNGAYLDFDQLWLETNNGIILSNKMTPRDDNFRIELIRTIKIARKKEVIVNLVGKISKSASIGNSSRFSVYHTNWVKTDHDRRIDPTPQGIIGGFPLSEYTVFVGEKSLDSDQLSNSSRRSSRTHWTRKHAKYIPAKKNTTSTPKANISPSNNHSSYSRFIIVEKKIKGLLKKNVPRGGIGTFFTIKLKSNEPGSVKSIKFGRNGNGKYLDFDELWLETKNGIILSKKIKPRSDQFKIRLIRPIKIVPRREVTVNLVGRISESANIGGSSRFVIYRNDWIKTVRNRQTARKQDVVGGFPLSGYTVSISEKSLDSDRLSNSSRRSSRTHRTRKHAKYIPVKNNVTSTSKVNISPSSNHSPRSEFITVEKKINGPLKKNISRGDIGTFFTIKLKSNEPGSVKSIEFSRNGNGTYLDFDQLWLESNNGIILSKKIKPRGSRFKIKLIKPIKISPRRREATVNLVGRISDNANIGSSSRFVIYRNNWIKTTRKQDVVGGFPLSGYTVFINEKSLDSDQLSNSSRRSSRTRQARKHAKYIPAKNNTTNTSKVNIPPSSNHSSHSRFIIVEKKIKGPLKKNVPRGGIGTFFTIKFKSNEPGSVKSIKFGRNGNGKYLDFDELWLETNNGIILSKKIKPRSDQFKIRLIKPIKIVPRREVTVNLVGRISESADIGGSSRFVIYRNDWIKTARNRQTARKQDVVGGFPLSGYTVFISEKLSDPDQLSSDRQPSRTHQMRTYTTYNPATKTYTADAPLSNNSSSFSPFIIIKKEINGPLKKNISRGNIGTFFTFKFKSNEPGSSIKSIMFGKSGNGTLSNFDQLWLESNNGTILSNKIKPRDDRFKLRLIEPIKTGYGKEVVVNLVGIVSESANVGSSSRFVIYSNDWIQIVRNRQTTSPQNVVGGFPLSGYTIKIK